MRIGDKVRFLNEVGGGKVTGFRPGGIVLVADEDGFDMPVSQNEVVVIEEEAPKAEKQKKPAPASLDGREYLKSKTVTPANEEEDTVDEQLEARVVRLEQALQQQTQALQRLEDSLQKAVARIALLEAENNLRKNTKMMTRQAKPKQQPLPATEIGDLKIL